MLICATERGGEGRIHSLLTKEGVDVNNVPLSEALPPLVGSLQSVPQGIYIALVGTLQSTSENSVGRWN